jgi:solute:Na+ symporter, SSS family
MGGAFHLARPMNSTPQYLNWIDYSVLAGYFLVLILIGVWSAMRIKRQEDFFMGGRSFGKLLQTFAAFGAGTGSSDPVNTGRTTFTSGMSGMWSVMYWLFVTPFYWITGVWYRRMRHLTLGDWFTERYESRALGLGYAIFGLLFYMVYGSMLFSAVGKVAAPMLAADFVTLAGQEVPIEYVLVPVIGLVVLIYGIAGGLEAAYFTDLIQGLCIILLSIILIPFGLQALVNSSATRPRNRSGRAL